MWELIKDNHGAIGAIASVFTLGIWALYLQLLLNNYRHRTRPKININRGAGPMSSARCVVTNMSAEAVYVEAILITLWNDRERSVCSLSDLSVSLSTERDPRSQFYQGPLSSGELIDIGSFDELIEHAEEAGKAISEEAQGLEVLVVGTYTADDGLVAAERAFTLEREGEKRFLKPQSFGARQIRSRRERRELETFMLKRYEHDAFRGADDSPRSLTHWLAEAGRDDGT